MRRCIADLLSWAEQRLEVIWKKQKENFRDAERLVSTLDQECFRATFESKFYETEDDLLTQQPNDAGASPVRMALPHVGYAYHDLCDLTDKLRVDFLSKADNKRTKPKEDTRLTLMRFFYAIYFYSHYKEDYKCVSLYGVSHNIPALGAPLKCQSADVLRQTRMTHFVSSCTTPPTVSCAFGRSPPHRLFEMSLRLRTYAPSFWRLPQFLR